MKGGNQRFPAGGTLGEMRRSERVPRCTAPSYTDGVDPTAQTWLVPHTFVGIAKIIGFFASAVLPCPCGPSVAFIFRIVIGSVGLWEPLSYHLIIFQTFVLNIVIECFKTFIFNAY